MLVRAGTHLLQSLFLPCLATHAMNFHFALNSLSKEVQMEFVDPFLAFWNIWKTRAIHLRLCHPFTFPFSLISSLESLGLVGGQEKQDHFVFLIYFSVYIYTSVQLGIAPQPWLCSSKITLIYLQELVFYFIFILLEKNSPEITTEWGHLVLNYNKSVVINNA